jgi:hypothetical protein
MGVPCTPVSTVEVAAGPGVTVSLLGGVYTVSADTTDPDIVSNYKVYATTAARDLDNPAPSSGDMAWTQADDRRWVHDGTGWIIEYEPWTVFTPSSTNITVGSGTLTGRHQRRGGTCEFVSVFTFGAGSAMGTNPTIGLPFATAALLAQHFNVSIQDSTTQYYAGMTGPVAAAASSVAVYAMNAAIAVGGTVAISSTVPFTWATGDVLAVGGSFEMNSRYT